MSLTPLSDEFSKAELGDPRRTARAGMIADRASRAPGASLPVQAGDDGQLEATYRFLNNEHVAPEALLDAHARRTVERAAEVGKVAVLHDTTTFSFGGAMPRAGCGPVGHGASGKGRGFLTHASLCVALDGRPLGTLGLYSWSRQEKPKGKRSQQASQYDPDREMLRWSEAAHQTHERVHGRAEAIHVMDREGDCMELEADLKDSGIRFVIRVAHDRRLMPGRKTEGLPKLNATLADAPVLLEREVPLTERRDKGRSGRLIEAFPARKTRLARLEVRAQTLTIYPGNGAVAHLPAELEQNFVEVREVDAPDGEAPVLWRLVTTEPTDTPEAVAAVVDIYRLRWMIEEFFKALKTGCGFEKLQLESGDALVRALTIYVSVAWRLLLLRWMDRHQPDAPATAVVSPTQLKVLRAVRARARKPMPAEPTAHDVLAAIAALGAHLKNNGAPGWRVLGRGFDKLLFLELGWLAATSPGAAHADL